MIPRMPTVPVTDDDVMYHLVYSIITVGLEKYSHVLQQVRKDFLDYYVYKFFIS